MRRKDRIMWGAGGDQPAPESSPLGKPPVIIGVGEKDIRPPPGVAPHLDV
jgi:hypothetical protein